MSKLNSLYLKQKFKSGGVSTLGYKRNSPDVNNPYNIIPSNRITMQDVDFPILGIDDIGNQIMMQPGQDYTFPGSYVTEFPMKNMGNKRFAQPGMNKPIYTSDWRKVQAYNDSLNLYNTGRRGINALINARNIEDWKNFVKNDRQRDYPGAIDSYNRLTNLNRTPPSIYEVATRVFNGGRAQTGTYKKPVQPYIYQKTDPYKEYLGRIKDLKPMGIRPTDLGAESEMPRTVNIPTRTLNSNLPRVKHSANYFESPEIVTNRTPEEGFYKEIRTPLKKTTSKPEPKEIKPIQGKRTSNPKTVYQNYKLGGTVRQSKSQVKQTLKYSKQKPNKI
jgi:hypothetical protein